MTDSDIEAQVELYRHQMKILWDFLMEEGLVSSPLPSFAAGIVSVSEECQQEAFTDAGLLDAAVKCCFVGEPVPVEISSKGWFLFTGTDTLSAYRDGSDFAKAPFIPLVGDIEAFVAGLTRTASGEIRLACAARYTLFDPEPPGPEDLFYVSDNPLSELPLLLKSIIGKKDGYYLYARV